MESKEREVPIHLKVCLTLEEASILTGIGKNKLREISDKEDCNFVLFVGNKRLLKREQLTEYIKKVYSI